MCGRYALAISPKELSEHFGLAAVPDMPPRYNIAPSQMVAIIREGEEGREIALVRWGLVPSWAKEPSIGNRLINARSETVFDKPAFRAAVRRRRCLIPASGFYEWQQTDGRKQPYYIRRADEAPLALAGVWEHWEEPDGLELQTCAILTTGANGLMRPIHDRMPVILEPGNFGVWLGEGDEKPEVLKALLVPAPEEGLTTYPISTWVNRPENDDPKCIEAIKAG